MWNDLLEWVLAVIQHWQVLMTGGIITALLTVAESYREKGFSWHFSKWVLLVFFVIACFLAWREQRLNWKSELDARTKLEMVRPYVVIEGVPITTTKRAYLFIHSPKQHQIVLRYNLRSLAGTIPAHNIKVFIRVSVVSANGDERTVPVNNGADQGQGQVLLPGEFTTELDAGTSWHDSVRESSIYLPP